MSVLYFLPILWLLSAVIDYSELCYLWQLKEYRWDRMRDFFSTPQARSHWMKYILLLRALVIGIILLTPWNAESIYQLFGLISLFCGLFLVDIIYALYRWRHGQFRRPILTIKTGLLIILSIVLEFLLAVFLVRFLFFSTFLRPLVISLVVGLIYLPTKAVKELLRFCATQKLKKYPDITIIGITGSYGKTSTKEFLAHILAGKFRVLKTPENQNNDIGIAKFILNNDLSKADILVIEMGAYRKGDIQYYCDMVNPKIGILTAINEQHLSLFGDMKTTQETKYALLRCLPKDGLAVTNSDNEYCREFLGELTAPIQTFGKDNAFQPTCRIEKIDSGEHNTKAMYTLPQNSLSLVLPFPGAHYALNMAPCILVARHLGMTNSEIIERCALLPPLRQGIILTYGKAILIDDSYNSNPAGFSAGLDLLDQFGHGRKKIVITRGMLELGTESDRLHEEIGEKIGEYIDELIVITPDFVEPLKRGIGNAKIHVVELYDPIMLVEYVKSLKTEHVALLIENRVPEAVKKEIQ